MSPDLERKCVLALADAYKKNQEFIGRLETRLAAAVEGREKLIAEIDRLKERCNEFVFVLNNRDMERNELRTELEKALDKSQQHMNERDALRAELDEARRA